VLRILAVTGVWGLIENPPILLQTLSFPTLPLKKKFPNKVWEFQAHPTTPH